MTAVSVGAANVTVKIVLLVAMPPSVTTEILRRSGASGTATDLRIRIDDKAETLKFRLPLMFGRADAVEINRRCLREVRALITTIVPWGPVVCVKPLMVGAAATGTMNVPLVAVPPNVTTEKTPLVAPAGNDDTSISLNSKEKLTGELLNNTLKTFAKPEPWIRAISPANLPGTTSRMVGAGGALTVVRAPWRVPPGTRPRSGQW